MKFKDFLNEAPKTDTSPDGIKLLQLLLREISSGKVQQMKLHPTMQQEALDEAVLFAQRVAQGSDGDAMITMIGAVADDLKSVRKALLPIPTRVSQLDDAGIWFKDTDMARTFTTLQNAQMNVMRSSIMADNLIQIFVPLVKILHEIEVAGGRRNGEGVLDSTQLSFAKATFKKLGIL
jgi:hypothetical protein